jgi:trigger factor
MQITKKELAKNQIELAIEVSVEELKPHLTKAAQRLALKNKIPGFRPGKAPLALIKSKFGDMAIHQEALDSIITETFYQAVTQEKLETVGQPNIAVEKMAPDNPLVYKATVSLLPQVILGDWRKLAFKKNTTEATEEDIKKTLEQLQNMNVKETIADRASAKGDKVEIDFEVYLDKVIVEGGKNHKYPVILGDSQMIPGFEAKLTGRKANEELAFELKFPEKYFQKNLAGKLANFKVKIIAVYDRLVPELDDDFAKTIGLADLVTLRKQLRTNISLDKATKEKQRLESEALKEIVKLSKIEDIPEILIDNEVHKMIHEFEHSLNQQGMDLPGYLKSLNKTSEDLRKDLRVQATERVKTALIMRQIAMVEKIKVEDKDIEAEIKKQVDLYKNNKEALKNIQAPVYRNYVANFLTNQKIIKLITEAVIK